MRYRDASALVPLVVSKANSELARGAPHVEPASRHPDPGGLRVSYPARLVMKRRCRERDGCRGEAMPRPPSLMASYDSRPV